MKGGIDVADLKKQLSELELKRIELEDHEEQMKKKEKLMPWYFKIHSNTAFDIHNFLNWFVLFYTFVKECRYN